jgi:hypothetical protein
VPLSNAYNNTILNKPLGPITKEIAGIIKVEDTIDYEKHG